MKPKDFKIKTMELSHEANWENDTKIWKNIPVEVNNKIQKYLTPEELIEFKKGSPNVKRYMKKNKVLRFYVTMDRLDKIIIGLNPRKYANRRMFALK
jgi:hypothetical protein